MMTDCKGGRRSPKTMSMFKRNKGVSLSDCGCRHASAAPASSARIIWPFAIIGLLAGLMMIVLTVGRRRSGETVGEAETLARTAENILSRLSA